MQITLNQDEIEKAIVEFVANQGISITGNVDVKLTAGRGPNGTTAVIDITGGDDKPEAKPETVSGGLLNDKAEEAPVASDDDKDNDPEADEPAADGEEESLFGDS
jgi:hypothetical protein